MSSLRSVYNAYVRSKYKVECWGDSHPHQTELIELKVLKLGLNFEEFVEIACALWHEFALAHGMQYPVWRLVTGAKTFERIGTVLQVLEPTLQDPNYATYEFELLYAQQYMDWLAGSAPKPIHYLDVPDDVKWSVAKQLCREYQIPYLSSNYNIIYRQIHAHQS